MPEYDDEIDAIGLKCPMPILKCKKGLNALETSQTLKITTTDKSAKKDFEALIIVKTCNIDYKKSAHLEDELTIRSFVNCL